jgi:hypothetical protein
VSSPDKQPWLVERVTGSRFLRDADIGQEVTTALGVVDQAMARQGTLEMYATGSAMSVAAVLGLYLQYVADQVWWGGGSWLSVARPLGLVIGSAGLVSIIHASEKPRLWVKVLMTGVSGAAVLVAASLFWPGGWLGLLTTVGLVAGWFVLTMALTVALTVPAERFFASVRPEPKAELIAEMVKLFAIAADDVYDKDADVPERYVKEAARAASWRSDSKERVRFARAFCYAARRVEQQWPRLASPGMSEVRMQLRERGARIAAGFRRHARDVVLGGSTNDERLAPALAAGVIAACKGSWEELTRAESMPLTRRLVADLAQRLTTVALFVIAALLLPDLLTLTNEATTQLRAGLLVAAVLALTGTPQAAFQKASEKAAEVFGKSPKV